MSNFGNIDILQYALDHDILDVELVQKKICDMKRKELLKKHPYAIWEDREGIWHTYLPDKNKKRVHRKRNTKEEIETLVCDYLKQQIENPTVEEVFTEWNDRKLDLKKITGATHQRNESFFKRHYSSMGKRRIKAVTPSEWQDFLEEQIAKYELSAKSFAGLKGITKGFLQRAKRRGLIDFPVNMMFSEMDNSDASFRRVYKDDTEEVFTDEEMKTLMQYLIADNTIISYAVLLVFLTGMRIGEVVSLKKEDYSEDLCVFYVHRTETTYSLHGKSVCEVKDNPKTDAGNRSVFLPKDYAWVVQKILWMNPDGEYLFWQDGCRINAQRVRRRLGRACDKTNVPRRSPHKIRKTYCSILLDNNIDKNFIIGQVGHTDIACTEKYYHRNMKTKEKKSAIISSIPEFQVC